MSVFQEIREKSAWVAQGARWVARDDVALDRLAKVFLEAPPSESEAAENPFSDAESTLAFWILLDAVNFGSGWFPFLHKPVEASGYKTVARALRLHCESQGVPKADALVHVRAEDCAEIFDQRGNSEVLPLMTLFAQSWNDLGSLLLADHGGRFEALVSAADGSAEKLVESLLTMPLYRDVAEYRGVTVPFYKRAQITCADLHLAFSGEGFGRFDDIDELTLFADNLVPHVLRVEGVLVYHPELLRRISQQVCLEPGCEFEVEIRAAAVAAVEALSERLAALGRPTPARTLDHWLWHRGQSPEMKSTPRHRARCAFY